MEIFKLFGSVMIDTAKAEESLHKVESKFTIGQKMKDFGGKMKDVRRQRLKATFVTAPDLVAGRGCIFKFAADLQDASGQPDQIFKEGLFKVT